MIIAACIQSLSIERCMWSAALFAIINRVIISSLSHYHFILSRLISTQKMASKIVHSRLTFWLVTHRQTRSHGLVGRSCWHPRPCSLRLVISCMSCLCVARSLQPDHPVWWIHAKRCLLQTCKIRITDSDGQLVN